MPRDPELHRPVFTDARLVARCWPSWCATCGLRKYHGAVESSWTRTFKRGVLEWHGKHPKLRTCVRVTPRGWGALARQPMQPWRKRPSDDLRAKIAQKVLDEMLVALKNEQAENRMRALRP